MVRRASALTLSSVAFFTLAVVAFLVVQFYLGRSSWVNHTITVRRELIEAGNAAQMTQRGQRGYLLTGKAEYLKPYDEGMTVFKEKLDSLMEKTKDVPTQQSRLESIRKSSTELFSELASTIQKTKNGHKDEAFEMVSTDRGEYLIRSLLNDLRQCTLEEDRLLEDRKKSLVWIGFGCLFSFFLIGASVTLILQSMLVDLHKERETREKGPQHNFGRSLMVSLLVWVLVLGVIAYVINKLDIPPTFKQIAYVILGLILILALLGVLPGGPVLVVRN